MAMIGQGKTRGQVAVLNAEAAINQNCVAIILKDGIDRDYVWHQLLFRYKQIRNISNSSGQQNLNGEIIKGIVLPFPAYNQQCYIGKLLNQWDAAIEKTETLIAAKKKRFKWLLSTLISNQQGKPEWREVKLGEVASISEKHALQSIEHEKLLTVKLHCLGIEPNKTSFRPKLNPKGRPYFERNTGEFLIGRQNFHNGGFGIVPEELEGYIASSAITSLSLDRAGLDTDFLFYSFSRADYYKKIGHIMDGTGQKELSDKQILNLPILLPSLSLQKQIANILNTAQRENALLEQFFKQCRVQKHGLMQKLLTGKWRIEPNIESY